MQFSIHGMCTDWCKKSMRKFAAVLWKTQGHINSISVTPAASNIAVDTLHSSVYCTLEYTEHKPDWQSVFTYIYYVCANVCRWAWSMSIFANRLVLKCGSFLPPHVCGKCTKYTYKVWRVHTNVDALYLKWMYYTICRISSTFWSLDVLFTTWVFFTYLITKNS